MSSLVSSWILQSSAIALVALAVASVLGRRGAGVREAMLTVAALKFLVPPIALSFPAILPSPAFDDVAVAAASIDRTVVDVVMLVHAAGVLVVLCMLVASVRQLRRLVAAARPADEATRVRAGRLADRLGLRRPVSILISDAAIAPFAAGIVHPVIVIPGVLQASLTDAEIDAVLVHELAHHARGHVAISWIRALLCAAWWWNPLAWRTSSVLRRVQEDVCDDAVVRWSGLDVDRYCDALVRAARLAASPAIVPALAERAHPLARRLRRLIDGANAPAPRWQVWTMAVVLAMFVLPARAPRPVNPAGPAAAIVYRDVYDAIVKGGAPEAVAARIAGRVASQSAARPSNARPFKR